MSVAVISDWRDAIRGMAHLHPGPVQQLASAIHEHSRAIHHQGIDVAIHWVPRLPCIPGNEDINRPANNARQGCGYPVSPHIYTSAANRARQISEGRMAANAKREAERFSKHYCYRPKGKAGTTRSVPLQRVKPLPVRFQGLISVHALTGAYLKWFGQRVDDICWLCRRGAVQTQEHLFRHFSPWNGQQTSLWKRGEKATGWKVGRFRHVQMSELFSMEIFD